jgi:Mrp family chromosome partitioning ATPase
VSDGVAGSGTTGGPQVTQFQLLRAHVEREVPRSAVILVTSARAGDGTSLTARGLARCFADSGCRTALVTTRDGHASPVSQAACDDLLVTFRMPKAESARIREAAATFVESSRASFDYTIVDSPPLLFDAVALALAGIVDGVLVSVRVGRAPSDDDESMIRIIEHSNGRVLGVVAVLPEAIADFEARRAGEAASGRIDRQPVSVTLTPAQSLPSLVQREPFLPPAASHS